MSKKLINQKLHISIKFSTLENKLLSKNIVTNLNCVYINEFSKTKSEYSDKLLMLISIELL